MSVAPTTVTLSTVAPVTVAPYTVVVDATEDEGGDSFDGVALDASWEWYREEVADYSVSDSEFHQSHVPIVLNPAGPLWFSGFEGMLVYKLIDGDFDVVAWLRLSNDADNALPTISGYKVAGLQAHDPTRPDFNYVHVGLGVLSPDHADLRAEWKTTVDSQSDSGALATGEFDSISWPSGEGQIRLTRVGDVFTMYVRPLAGGAWTQLQQVTRADLPEELQVGLTFYSNANNVDPDVTAHWDRITGMP